ncbi:MAG: uracil-DNA glycosylase [Acidimicrobiia bacterium]|nr:uracil-DNA glycosylase [Acidimicrobiia bacterium]
MTDLEALHRRIVACRSCPRLVEWREHVASEKRAAFRGEEYWGRPVPGFGDPKGRLVVIGLAPAAHGANRTGRMFTGDRSGDFLFASLARTGFANRPSSVSRDDGLILRDCYVTAAVKCAPPKNRPTRQEVETCRGWLEAELDLLQPRAIVALGQIGFSAACDLARRRGWYPIPPRSSFGHGVAHELTNGPRLLASYHPSQQNTFTGRLTPPMLDAVFRDARRGLTGSGRRDP